MPGKLTDTAIRGAKPLEKAYKLADGGGLYLEVAPSGGKWWRIKYRFAGKEKRLSLGVYPTVGLQEARARLEVMKETLRQGIDPGEQRKAQKAEAVVQGQSFEMVAREWHQKKRVGWTPKHAQQIIRRLENLAFPDLGNRPIAELGAPDFLAVLHKIEQQGHLETARRLAQICGQVTRYARLSGIVDTDAASHLSEALSAKPVRHHASITDPQEIGALLRAIDDYPGDVSISFALKILPYVFVRSSELRGATWAEIDLDRAEWLIPAERMKMRRPHFIPLARQVVALLRASIT